MSYPWYDILGGESNLQQGDLVPDCPILIPPPKISEGDTPEIRVELIDSIVLSQSCDLVNGKAEIVLVCPYYTLNQFLSSLPSDKNSSAKAKKKTIEDLRKGHLPSYHLINKDIKVDGLDDYQVVDFRNVYGIQFTALTEIVNSREYRIRLLPPYREHLSQAFARYFMRVGLPQDIRIEEY